MPCSWTQSNPPRHRWKGPRPSGGRLFICAARAISQDAPRRTMLSMTMITSPLDPHRQAPAAASCSPPSAPPARAKRKADGFKRQEAPPQKRSCCEKGANWKILSKQIAFQNVHSVFVEGYKAAVNGEHGKAGGSLQGQLMSIPLWPQYHLVRADGAPVKGTELKTTWIHANVSEQWLTHIADAMTNACVRDVVSATMKQLSPRLRSHAIGSQWFIPRLR